MAKARSQSSRDRAGGSRTASSAPANEEDIGLLAAGPDDDDGYGSQEEDGLIVHPGGVNEQQVLGAAAPRPPPASAIAPGVLDKITGSPGTPRTPRTPNRVRFDLRPTIVNGSANGDAHHRQSYESSSDPTDDTYDDDRASFDVDDADPLTRGSARRQQRLPLLTDIEAPSVALANSPFLDEDDPDAWAAAEHVRPKSGLKAAFMNMANSIIGAGIIGQPYAFKQAGLLSGVVLLVVLTVLVDWTIRLIVINSKLSGANSFQGTVEHCFGKPGLIAISVAQWAFAFGGMVAFGVIVGDSIPHVLVAVWPGLADIPVLGLLSNRRIVILVFTMCVSYPLALYRDISKLAKASTLALISMLIIVLTVVIQGFFVPSEDRGTLASWRLLVINDGIFQAIGVISFAFVCHHNSLLIYGSLKTPTIDRFTRVTHYSTGVSMLACLLMALAGFLTFGDRTLGNVLNNFPGDNSMVNVARLCFGLNMLTTLPLEAFVCREVMLNYYFPGQPFNMNLHLVFTTAVVIGAMTLSLLTCDLGAVFELVGATSAAAIAYILPPLCYIKLTTRSWKTYAAWGIVAFGCVVMAMSMLQALGKMIKGEGGGAQCM
ncbi:hypothetical protein GQ53DRAFT_749201 [Thozetella sp. PMI_491]|nr:hypothetical protein GQ53DRAFT_749201 [Thozetella sp. PMI_491]